MTVMLLQRSTAPQSTYSQKSIDNNNRNEPPFLILLDIQEDRDFDTVTCNNFYNNNNVSNITFDERIIHKNIETSTKSNNSRSASTSKAEYTWNKLAGCRGGSVSGVIAMRYYRLWIYACNIVVLISAIGFAAAVSQKLFFSSDMRRYLVPGLPEAYDPTALYAYFTLIVQFGLVQLLGCIAARRLSTRLLNAYWLLLLGLFFGDIFIGIVWVFRFERMKADLRPSLRLRLQVEYNKDSQFTEQWDQLQREFSCCGVTGPLDFGSQWSSSCCSSESLTSFSVILENSSRDNSYNTHGNNNSNNLTIMESCSEPHIQGCEDQLILWLRKTADLLFVLGFCVIAFTKLCFLGILRYEIREMIQKIQLLKEPSPPSVPFAQSFHIGQSSRQSQQSNQQQIMDVSVHSNKISRRTTLPIITSQTNSCPTSLLVQEVYTDKCKHPSMTNNQDGGVDSDTNSHCALILEESTPPTQHHLKVTISKKDNGNNNYELHELNRQIPLSDSSDNLASNSLNIMNITQATRHSRSS